MESLCATAHTRVGVPRRHHLQITPDRPAQYRDLDEPAPPCPVTPDVKQHLIALSGVRFIQTYIYTW